MLTSKPLAAVAIALGLSSGVCLGAEPEAGFARHWAATPLKTAQGPHGRVQGRLYQRYVDVDSLAVPVGTVSLIRMDKPKDAPAEAFSIPKAAEDIRKAMGFDAWYSRKQGKAEVFEAHWAKANRFVRVYMVDEGESFAVSVAMLRMGYAAETAVESELLQRRLTGVLQTRLPWLDRMVAMLETAAGIQTAHAACPACDSGNPMGIIACVQCPDESLIPGAARPNGGSVALPNEQENFDRTLESVEQVTRVGDSFNANMAATNVELRRTNNLMERVLSPTGAFVLGASTAAGAAVGALAVNAAVDLLSAAVSGFIGLFSSAKEDAERLKKFTEARRALEELEPKMSALESKIDSSLYIARLAKAAGGRGRLIAIFAQRLRRDRMKSAYLARLHQDALYGGQATAACLNDLNTEGARLDLIIDQTQDIIEALQAQGKDAICQDLERDIGAVMQAERAAQHARFAILNGRGPYEDALGNQFEETAELAREVRKRIKDDYDADVRNARKMRDEALALSRSMEEQYLDRCQANARYTAQLPGNRTSKERLVLRKQVGSQAHRAVREACERQLSQPGNPASDIALSNRQSIARYYEARLQRAAKNYWDRMRAPLPQPHLATEMQAHAVDDKWFREQEGKQSPQYREFKSRLNEARATEILQLCQGQSW